ncbi:MAG: dockerin type I repeat-containing protein [Candidatus Zixiibacteriota bacterium]
MPKTSFALVLGMVCLAVAAPVAAHWVPSDGHKMHWPQLPDEQGWDVNAVYPVVLADDWRCAETGPITDLHFWGSWRDLDGDRVGDVGVIQFFQIGIWSDVPDPDGDGPLYSHPGTRLWFQEVSNPHVVPIDPPTLEAWYDPSKDPDIVIPNDHDAYFQYNVFFDELGLPYFPQEAGTVYWLSISAFVDQSQLPFEWGWKSTIDHFNDDAVWAFDGSFQWIDIVEPPRVNDFSAVINPDGTWGGGTGTNYYGQGWYFYEATGWWNIWFYDNPFTYEHFKQGLIQCFVMPANPQLPANITIALNWSTDAWSNQDPPPDGPPLPGVDENQYIGRHVIFSGAIGLSGWELYEPFRLPVDYNPEWISVDIMGVNVMVMGGRISHECVTTSLDLAFVVTGPPSATGACCYPSGACAVVTQPACVGGGGVYLGNGTVCLGDNPPQNGIDDACEQVLPTGACCFADGSCTVIAQAACLFSGGVYAGDGTTCADLNGNGVADICEQYLPTGACCFDNGSCQVMIAASCSQAGGIYAGNGTSCAGDNNLNGVDDACEGVVTMGACCYGDPIMPICVNTTSTVCTQQYQGTWYAGQNCATFVCPVTPTGACCYTGGGCAVVTQASCAAGQGTYMGDGTTCDDADGDGTADICETLEHLKWVQPPDLTPMGMDVMATQRLVLADDFLCSETGRITRVVVYGSWFEDMIPDHGEVSFVLSFHEDIPAVPPEFSKPGRLICLNLFAPGTYTVEPVSIGGLEEGWYDPSQEFYIFPGDRNIFRYTFLIDDPCWKQAGTPTSPVVYWLDVQVQMPFEGPMFGWKTSVEHWNDDAVWAMGQEPALLSDWRELRYPPQHPMFPASIDLAFEIYGVTEADTCALQNPGDFDSDGDIDVADLNALAAFVQGVGAPPVVHANGDFNGDCRINGFDVTDMASYLATGGPPPVDCTCVEPYPFRDCCIGVVGNANLDPAEQVTIGDITMMIDAKFITGTCEGVLLCLTEADINQSGGAIPDCDQITIGDITYLVDYLFIGGPGVVILFNCF